MTTYCSGCGDELVEKEGDNYCICNHCGGRITPKGVPLRDRFKSKKELKIMKGGQKKMGEEKQFTGKSTFVVCSKCGQKKFTRAEVYDKRVAKFGSVEEMNKNYVCRNCKKQ